MITEEIRLFPNGQTIVVEADPNRKLDLDKYTPAIQETFDDLRELGIQFKFWSHHSTRQLQIKLESNKDSKRMLSASFVEFEFVFAEEKKDGD